MHITINSDIKELTPNFNIGVMICDVEVYDNKLVTEIIEELEKDISSNIDINECVNLDIIKQARDAYKVYGKDPSRYRLAVESLYRRLAKGNKLYRINNVVDLGNVLSIKTRKSVAVLDYSKIVGDVLIRLGKDEDEFHGIGRGKLNITNIPIYVDDISPFGSPTSDTERTMITDKTKKILLFIISFNGKITLKEELEHAQEIYEDMAKGKNFTTCIL